MRMRVDATTAVFWSLNREKREQELCSLREKNLLWRGPHTQLRTRSPHTLWNADPPAEEVLHLPTLSSPELSEFPIPFIRFITCVDTQTLLLYCQQTCAKRS